MLARITRWLEKAGNSLGGADALNPIDPFYGATWAGPVPATVEGRSMSAGRLPLVAAAHLPVF
ncbi:hypothetical protein [Mycolicibacterium aichiense]|uniref:Uncharacterized protein n=1 Tax=Mycolicibacterium aichiense TaxID=1799 RepID=A0AAD1HP10_9MYCO|nr:hypothetical protein [Mycolicibacterium aichiense]MCV7019423.1 hypothetical protein [Mycolicibacterium aichiense]BBX08270.1 hypothetical protein MAIC_30730 [Mycolicibacterium aichiense]STZ82071.1 Uncharacterised protein [Mycolicibacterium aichiense]